MSSPIVCVPAFADGAATWRPLLESLGRDAEVANLAAAPATIDGRAAFLAERLTGPVTLIGHSLGSAIAVEAAHRLGSHCVGLLSIEGNLTPEDAYFSGLAADYDDPGELRRVLTAKAQELVAAGQAPASFAESVAAADAVTMWTLGRDARDRGAGGHFGLRYRSLMCPTLYLWSASTTPQATANYLVRHQIPQRRLAVEHHWPWLADPAAVANALADLAEGGHGAVGLPEGS